MTKKEYILCLENLIINRIKFHSPKIEEKIDFSLLDAIGIDASFPIFIFDKPLNKIFYKAFYEVKKSVAFNLILTCKPEISLRKTESMDKTYIIFKEEMCSNLGRTLEQLNINYISHSDFKNKEEGERILINNKEINFDYLPYYFSKKMSDNGIVYDIKNFILNGKNYLLSFSNISNEAKSINVDFNLPLPRGYYYFKRLLNCISIENLTNKDIAYFNYNIKNAKITFSTMSGVESCTYACIHFECEIKLLPKQTHKIYFNFGDKKYCLYTPKEMNYFFELSQNKMNEIFDMKVTTKNSTFDEEFNYQLPKNIFEMWQKFNIDEASENKYIKLKNSLVNNKEYGLEISKTFKGLKEVRFFRNNGWKRVFIVHNNSCYMYADHVKYFNYALLTKKIFENNNEIYLSYE